jgi:hypothetical protein
MQKTSFYYINKAIFLNFYEMQVLALQKLFIQVEQKGVFVSPLGWFFC